MSTVFHLVRHADHGHVGRILTGRTPGIHLSPAGKADAGALARLMAGKRPDALFSSPQLRARETAEAIAAETGCPVRLSPQLDEIDFGAWTGRTFDELAADSEWQRWNAFRDDARTPAGESMDEVAARLLGLVGRLRQDFPGGAVCLVSHSDVIKAGLCRLRGRPFQEVHKFEVAPASVTTLAIGDDGARVLAVNVQAREQAGEFVA